MPVPETFWPSVPPPTRYSTPLAPMTIVPVPVTGPSNVILPPATDIVPSFTTAVASVPYPDSVAPDAMVRVVPV